MLFPENEPEYVIACEPTVPKVMELLWTVPLRGVGALANADILMVPLSWFPDCCHFSVNLPP